MGVKQSDIDRAIADGNKVLAQLKRVCPYPHENQTRSSIQSPQPQSAVLHNPLAKTQREKALPSRTIVRITSFRQRLLDTDNLCVKYLVDGLRYARLIRNDREEDIDLFVSQKKCAKGEERTEIELDIP